MGTHCSIYIWSCQSRFTVILEVAYGQTSLPTIEGKLKPFIHNINQTSPYVCIDLWAYTYIRVCVCVCVCVCVNYTSQPFPSSSHLYIKEQIYAWSHYGGARRILPCCRLYGDRNNEEPPRAGAHSSLVLLLPATNG